MNVTTVIKYLLPGSATTNAGAGVLGPETLRSALLLTVLITLSWPVATTLTIPLWSTSGRSRPSWADYPLVGGRDNFGREMQPN